MKLESSPLRPRSWWVACFVVGAVAIVFGVPWFPDPYNNWQVLVGLLTSLLALAYHVHSRHAQDTRFLKELLTDFNRRYNELNDELQAAVWSEDVFDQKKMLRFIDYFNLCAEEWLFRKAGYIYDPVWTAWENGMRQYAKDERVKRLWRSERGSESYYGFEFPVED